MLGSHVVAFPNQLVGATSAASSAITVTNTGSIAASFYFVRTGTSAGSFAAVATGGCGASSGAQCTIPPSGSLDFTVTFTPSAEGDISAGLNLVTTATPIPQLTLAGRGIDRRALVPASVIFPDTFRNPGDTATIQPVTIRNVGEYPMHVSSLALVGDPVWTFVDPPAPFDVPGLGSQDVMIRFAPTAAGPAATGMLSVTSDTPLNPTSVVALSGSGKDRNVELAPGSVDLGDIGAGRSTRLSDIKPGALVTVTNLDDTAFQIHAIPVEGDNAFEVLDLAGNTVTDVALPPGAIDQFDIVFKPSIVGRFHANAALYLDQDPSPQRAIALRARSTFDASSGGCSTTRPDNGYCVTLCVLIFTITRRRARNG
jgi:hypothetical protein